MQFGPSLGRQAIRRMLLAVALSGMLTTLVGTWAYLSANRQAADAQMASARDHYVNVIANLERRWGLEAFTFKVRLESQRFLENPSQRQQKLLTYLIAQGGSLEFTSLRIEDHKGHVVASFESHDTSTPKTKFMTGQESTWAMDPMHDRLYLVFRQVVWLGSENGYLLLFKPMDHALLTEYSYPRTRLSLWWQGKPLASSEGNDGLAAAAAALGKSENNLTQSLLPWSSTDSENTPLLFIESHAGPLLTLGQFAAPLVVSFIIIALAMWGIFGGWGMRVIQRIQALECAQSRFLDEGKIDEAVRQALDAGRGIEHDEITELTVKLEQIMQKTLAEKHALPANMKNLNS